MGLYPERGIKPAVLDVRLPPLADPVLILSALYWVFRDSRLDSHVTNDHFLFIPHLNAFPSEFPLIHGLPIPQLV